MASPFNLKERCWIVANFLLCKENSKSVKDTLVAHFKLDCERARSFHRQQFRRVYESFMNHGSVLEKAYARNNQRPNSSITALAIKNVKDAIEDNPRLSLSRISQKIVQKTTIND